MKRVPKELLQVVVPSAKKPWGILLLKPGLRMYLKHIMILRSGEDSLKLNELMELCTNLQQMVLDFETTKTTQANEIASLEKRVKKLERRMVMDIQEKDKNRSQNDKTEHENGKSVKEKSTQSQSQLREVELERASKIEPENLNCQKWAHPYPPSGPETAHLYLIHLKHK
ncbi:hypothetical protein Tco_0389614 [Tanacetum coccineum]